MLKHRTFLLLFTLFLTPVFAMGEESAQPNVARFPNASTGKQKPGWISPTDAISESNVYNALKNLNISRFEAYERLIQIRDEDPTRIEADYTIALLFIFKQKNYTQAHKHFLRCSKVCPEDVGTLVNLGTLSIFQGKYAEAFGYYRKVHKLGVKSAVLNHNLHKFTDAINSRRIQISNTAKQKFLDFAREVFESSAMSYDPNISWLFVPCSEGRAEESKKQSWFVIDGYRPYEFPICLLCNGTGRIFCPNISCSGGKIGYSVNKTYTFPNGETATMSTREYRKCEVCGGTNRITCPACKGSGEEYKPYSKPYSTRPDDYDSESDSNY